MYLDSVVAKKVSATAATAGGHEAIVTKMVNEEERGLSGRGWRVYREGRW